MLQDVLLTPEEVAVRDEVREFIRTEVPADLLHRMDRDEITYPRQFVEALGERNLLGLRFSKEYGGRGLSWRAELPASKRWACWELPSGAPFPCLRSSAKLFTPSGPKNKSSASSCRCCGET